MVCTEDFIVRHKSHISRSTLPRCRYEAWARTRVHIYNPGIRTYPMQRQGHDVAQLKTDGEMESTPLTDVLWPLCRGARLMCAFLFVDARSPMKHWRPLIGMPSSKRFDSIFA